MPRRKIYPSDNARKAAWDKNHVYMISVKFNLRADADIIAHLDAVKNRTGYIKSLIRADIARETPARHSENAKGASTMKKLQFEASPDGNVLHTLDNAIRAVVPVPDGASEDYGYLAMKKAILAAYHGTEPLEFWYDGQEEYLAPDAADGEPEVEIEEEC